MPPCEIHNLSHFGFRDLVAEHPNHCDALFVSRQHNLKRLRVGHAKETLQNLNHELHRRVVVVQQQNLVQRRPLGLGTGFDRDAGIRIIVIVHRHAHWCLRHGKFHSVPGDEGCI